MVTISLAKGGAERSCAMLSQMLESLGHSVVIVTLNDAIDFEYAGEVFNLGIQKTGRDSFFRRMKRFRGLRKFLKEASFDFVVDHRPKNLLLREVFYAKYLYRGFQKMYVYHTSKREISLTKFPKLFARFCGQNFANVAVSKYIKERLLDAYQLKHSCTIHNPYYKQWPLPHLELPNTLQGKKYILSYGRIEDSVKDLSFLMHSFEVSGLWKDKVFLVILGEGPDKKALQRESQQLKAAHSILFLPYTPNPKAIIEHSRFVTLTSIYEGFPMVLVESLSLGVPVVSLDIVSGPNEIIRNEHNGLLVEGRNGETFAKALRRMAEDESLWLQCKKNAPTSVQKFSFERTAQKWEKLINSENNEH